MPRLLKQLDFDCEFDECSSYKGRHCVASLTYNETVDQHTADVLFISMMPAATDAERKRFCTTQGHATLEKIINMVGAPPGGVAFTSLVRCRPKDPDGVTRDPNWTELDFCRDHLLRDLKRIKPKVLVFEGLEALQACKPTGKKQLLNRVVTVELGGQKYTALAIMSPLHFFQYTSLLTHVLDGVTKAIDIAELGDDSIHHPSCWEVNPELIYCDTVDKVKSMVDYLLHQTTKKQNCAFDVETKNLNARYGNNLVTLQFCVDPRERCWVVPFHYQHSPFMDEEMLAVKAELKRLFTEEPGFRYWLTHNGIFEQVQTMQFITDGNTFRNAPMFDTLNFSYNMDENRVTLQKVVGQGMALKVLTPEFVGRETYDEGVLGARAKGELYRLAPEDLVPYAADDVINTQLVFLYLKACARAQGYWEQVSKLTEHVGSGAYRTFAKLKRNGMFTDLQQLRALSSRTDSIIIRRMAEIKKIAAELPSGQQTNKLLAATTSGGQKPLFGTPKVFQFDKPEHYKALLFKTLAIKPVYAKNSDKKTEEPSVDKAFYEVYADAYPEVKLLQEYTGMKKLATSYTASVMGFVDPNSGFIDHNTDCRVRPDFGFTNTVTGRPSCQGPSIHNVPRADNVAKQEVKSMYAAQQSYGAWKLGQPVERVLMQLDYMAAEVRIWAVLSGDRKLAKALYDGKLARMEYKKNPTPENKLRAELEGDIHKQTASQMFGVPLDKVTKSLRQNTKAIVFALLYGGGPELIAARLKNDNIEEVKAMCDDFAKSFPIGNKWLKDIEFFARENLYVESPLGRRRRLLEFMTGQREAVGQAKRLARNAPIQGFASDACILGASFWNDWIETNNKDWKIVNIVHDSCVTEIPIGDIEEATEAAERCFTVKLMNEMHRIWGVDFICPLEVEFDFGVRWGHMKKWDGVLKNLPDLVKWLHKGGTDGKD
jgi:uracil-DNA glycosylase family 4